MRTAGALCATLLLGPVTSFAGIDLSWNACPGNGGVSDISLPCADADGLRTLYGTFKAPVDVSDFMAMDVTLELCVDSSTLPGFFNMLEPLVNPTGCNENWFFGDERPASCSSASPALWGTFPPGGQANIYAAFRPLGGNRGLFRASVFRTTPIAMLASVEYFAFKLDLYMGEAEEAGGTCAGCMIGTLWSWTQASLQGRSQTGPPVVVTQPGSYGLQVATFGGGWLCIPYDPVRPTSWGTLKALYR